MKKIVLGMGALLLTAVVLVFIFKMAVDYGQKNPKAIKNINAGLTE